MAITRSRTEPITTLWIWSDYLASLSRWTDFWCGRHQAADFSTGAAAAAMAGGNSNP